MTHARIDAASLRAVGASPVLALAGEAFSAGVRMADGEPALPSKADVAVMTVSGPLAQRATAGLCAYVDGYDAVAARFELALEASTSGVVLVIDSPGGDVAGLEAAVERMRAAKQASGRRVVAYVDELAASAAYWIASGVADEIVAPAAARVGSIGCIGALVDETKAEEMAGREWIVHREPAGKADGMSVAPLRGLAAERMATNVRECAGRFYEAVAASRGLDVAAIKGLDGAVLNARAAKRARLIDRVGGLDVALGRASIKAPKRQEKRMDKMFSALGLSLGAGDDEIQAAVLARLDGDAARIDGLEAGARELAAKLAEAREEAAALRAEKAEADKAADVAARADMLAAAVADGRLAPAKVEGLAAKAEQHGTEWLAAVLDAMPVIAPSRAPVAAAVPTVEEQAAPGLSPEIIARAKSLGVDPNRVAETLGAILKR